MGQVDAGAGGVGVGVEDCVCVCVVVWVCFFCIEVDARGSKKAGGVS